MLVVIRGNSGSGKSSLALSLREALVKSGTKNALISQDYFRRTILKEKDRINNLDVVNLLDLNIRALISMGYLVILEGILTSKKYGDMLIKFNKDFGPKNCLFYYYDVSFEETLRRHKNKPNSNEFGEEQMRKWWQDEDALNLKNEIIIKQDLSLTEAREMILEKLEDREII